MNERQKKVFMGLHKSLKIWEDVVDVMAQTRWLLEDTTHPNTNIKRFKEMVKAMKRKKKLKVKVWIPRFSNF